ncbi:GAF domain-containing protein [Pseudidiomarina sp. E22-M8]|uniref:GAF domain-containing protein n=1 Tax=Pseudidiomarina sp. E22-M8 TaxID=3424768 RepID=UPI00403CF955
MATSTSGFIKQCEQEALHLTGAIQPHGAVLVLDHEHQVTHASVNIGEIWRGDAKSYLGKAVPPQLRGLLQQYSGERIYFAAELVRKDDFLDVVFSPLPAGGIVIELVPTQREGRVPSAMNRFPEVIKSDDEVRHYQQLLITYIAELTKATRVMYYEFLATGDGEVTAEAKHEQAQGSFFQLRFPASDIPQIARRLYLRNPWRAIYDAHADAVPLVSADDLPVPDLTHAELRSVSPVHLHYLCNMGVRASVSWPIAGKDELLALISLHHDEPRVLDYGMLRHISELVKAYNFALRDFRSQQRIQIHERMQNQFKYFHQQLLNRDDRELYWQEMLDWLMREFACDGVLIETPQQTLKAGLEIEPETQELIIEHLENQGEQAWFSDNLLKDLPQIDLTAIAGVAVLTNVLAPDHEVAFFALRHAHMHEVMWGGRPDKPDENQDPDVPISPRRSFEKWVEMRYSNSKPWEQNTLIKLMKLRLLLNEI